MSVVRLFSEAIFISAEISYIYLLLKNILYSYSYSH